MLILMRLVEYLASKWCQSLDGRFAWVSRHIVDISRHHSSSQSKFCCDCQTVFVSLTHCVEHCAIFYTKKNNIIIHLS